MKKERKMSESQKQKDLAYFMKNEESRRAYIDAGKEVKKMIQKEKESYRTWKVFVRGKCIASKTYEKPKTKNQLRNYAVSHMVNIDIGKVPFYIAYE